MTATTQTMPVTLSARLADFAAAFTPSAVPPAVVAHAKLCILDSVGIALAANHYDFAACTGRALRALAGPGDAPVIGQRAGLPLRDAVLLNGTLIHGLDFDDTHGTSVVHCSASALPVAFNLGLVAGASGALMLAAYVLAVEIDARLGEVAQGSLQRRGYHPTGIIGAFGCAAAAAWLKRLPAAALADALGITLSMASGSMEFLTDGAWTKRMHPGWAGVAGITAAALAAEGFKGPAAAFEGRYGLYNTLLGSAHGVDIDAIGADLGHAWRTTGIAFKPYPACHFNHVFADCALALKRAHGFAPSAIRRITALIHPEQVDAVCEPLAQKRRPASHYEAQFSVPWMVACALLRERFTLAELEPAALADEGLLALAARVDHAPDAQSRYPAYYSGGLRIELDDGRVFAHHCAVNRGSDADPLSVADIHAKFMSNATVHLTPAAADALAEAIMTLDSAPSLAPLAALLAVDADADHSFR